MKIVVLGKGLLFDDFKELTFQTVEDEFFNLDFKCLDEYDTIINTYDSSFVESTSISPSSMYLYNAEIPAILSEYCKCKGKKFVHISSGKVYRNSTIPQNETDNPSVITAYESTRLLGEKYCNDNDLILRTSGLFNSKITPQNILYKTMMQKSNINIPISLTYTLDLIRSGIFNVSSNGLVSLYDIAPCELYLKRDSIPELNLKENTVTVMNISKLLQYHITENTTEKILECYENIIYNIQH
jgi:hypothetical protein